MLKPLNILIVDDDDSSILALEKSLRDSLGSAILRIEVAASPAAAREAVETSPYDLNFVDYDLALGEIGAILAPLRFSGRAGATIVLFGAAHEETARRALAAGAPGFLLKSSLLGSAVSRTVRVALSVPSSATGVDGRAA